MGLKNDLRGYLLAMAVHADEPIGLSSEDVHEAFASDYPDFEAFDDAFGNALDWLAAEGFIRFDTIYLGTNQECCVLDLTATAKGEKAVEKLADQPERSGGVHVEVARMIGAGLGEFLNTQK